MQWQKNIQLIDANVIIRCILDDCPDMTVKATEVIDNGAYTKPEIIAEVVYVLQKVYSVERKTLRTMIYDILDVVACDESDCVLYAMDVYSEISLDFVDCLLIAYNKINREKVFSFDKKLNKRLEA